MPTKPTVSIVEYASNATYTIGPKAGEPSKADYTGIAAIGHVPGPDNASTAEEQNDFQNKISLVAKWVQEGSSSKLLSAHLVEANGTGCVGVACLDVGGTSSNQPPAVFGENTGTNSPSAHVTSGENDGIRSEATEQYALIARSRGQLGDTSFWTADIDGTWDDGSNPVGKSGGLRVLADNDETLAPAPGPYHPLNSRALFARNLGGVAAEFIAFADATHSDNAAVRIRNFSLEGDGLHVNTQAGPEPLGGKGIVSHGGSGLFLGDGNPANLAGGSGIVGRGGVAPANADNVFGGGDSPSGAGVVGYAGFPLKDPLGGSYPAGAGIYGISDAPDGVSHAARFERIGAVNDSFGFGAIVSVEGNPRNPGFIGVDSLVGEGYAFQAESRGGACLKLTPTESEINPGRFGPHIEMTPLDGIDPSVPTQGDVWLRTDIHPSAGRTGKIKYRHDSETHYLASYLNSPFRNSLTAQTGSPQDSDHNANEVTLISSFGFNDDNLPTNNGLRVVFRIYLRARFVGGTADPTTAPHIIPPGDNFTLRLYDLTAGSGPQVSRPLTLTLPPQVANEPTPWEDRTAVMLYTIPLAGQRAFDLRFVANHDFTAGISTVEIQDLQVEMSAWGP